MKGVTPVSRSRTSTNARTPSRGAAMLRFRVAFRASLTGCAMAALGVAAALAYAGDALYARPGHRVDIGGQSLNLYCNGKGSPTIILEAGLGGRASTWSQVQPELSKST